MLQVNESVKDGDQLLVGSNNWTIDIYLIEKDEFIFFLGRTYGSATKAMTHDRKKGKWVITISDRHNWIHFGGV